MYIYLTLTKYTRILDLMLVLIHKCQESQNLAPINGGLFETEKFYN